MCLAKQNDQNSVHAVYVFGVCRLAKRRDAGPGLEFWNYAWNYGTRDNLENYDKLDCQSQ